MSHWVAVGQRIQNTKNLNLLATILSVDSDTDKILVEWVDQTTGFHGESGYSLEEVLAEWEPCPM